MICHIYIRLVGLFHINKYEGTSEVYRNSISQKFGRHSTHTHTHTLQFLRPIYFLTRIVVLLGLF